MNAIDLLDHPKFSLELVSHLGKGESMNNDADYDETDMIGSIHNEGGYWRFEIYEFDGTRLDTIWLTKDLVNAHFPTEAT